MNKHFKKAIKKIILSVFIISEIFLLSIPSAFGSFKIPSFGSVADEGEDRYNVSGEAVRDMAQSMNVGGLKSTVPELMIIFSPQNPNPGEEMSAQALPMYFSNDAKSLYFTWYLRHNSEGGDDGKGNTDWNGGGVDIEDYKIEAMRILAQGGWEPDLDKNGDGDEDDTEDYASINAWYNAQTDDDNDGYDATSGGDNKKGMKNWCYLHDYTGGKNYEFTESAGGSLTPDFNCPSGMTPICANTYPIGDVPGQIFDTCLDDNKRDDGEDEDLKDMYCTKSTGDAKCHKGEPVCYETKQKDEYRGIFDGEILLHGEEELWPRPCPDCEPEVPGGPFFETEPCESENFPKPQCSSGPVSAGGQCGVGGTDGKYEHLFPWAPGHETGGENKSFGLDEERFWGTNPHDPSTSGNGYSDEAVVAGLGQEIFKWAYQEGDLVGVVIEGTSILTTKHDDSSNMIMWAFVNNHCSAGKVGAKGTTSIKAGTYDVKIDTIQANINKDCLKEYTEGDHLEAFMDPVGGASENLELKLSYMPEFPINDPTGDRMGDVVSFQAIINNSNKPENELLYNWEVDICSNGTFNCSNGSWRDIAPYLMAPYPDKPQEKLLEDGIKGNGLSELKFELGIDPDRLGFGDVFPNNIGYVRVKVKVRETFSSGMSRQGIATATMKVISSDKKIQIYKVGNNQSNGEPNAVGDPNLQLVDSNNNAIDGLTPICSGNGIDGAMVESNVVCRVMKNEIIGLQVPSGDNLSNFNWTLDGKPLVCDADMSGNCEDDNATSINFFPVTKSVGESYTLTITATENVNLNLSEANKPTAGKKVTLVKRFEVIEPYVKLVSEGEDLSKFLGTYAGLDSDASGGQILYEDKSESVFEIESGKAITLKAEMHPAWINIVKLKAIDGTDVEAKEWLVDGLTQEKQDECVAKETAEQVPAEKTRCVPFGMVDCSDGNSKNCINFTAGKKEGEAYSINFTAAYNKDLGIRRALFDIWDVIQQESGDGQLADSLVVEVLPAGISAQSAPKRFLASLSSNLPGQVIFLLRIILTGFIIILVSGIVFSLSSRREEVGGRD